jgi:hypothetical protein
MGGVGRAVWLVAAVAALAACGFDWDGFEPRAGGDGGVGDAGSDVVGGAGSGGAPGGGSPTGGSAPMLVNRNLVARYYINEAPMGQGPTQLLDAAPDPLDVPILYTASLAYQQVMGNRGLEWLAADSARAAVAIDDTKFVTMLDGARQITLEAVVDQPVALVDAPRLIYLAPLIDPASDGQLSMHFSGMAGQVKTNFNSPLDTIDSGFSTASVVGLGRVVIHTVIDTAQPLPEDRVKIYIAGALQPEESNVATPLLDEALSLPSGAMVFGNRIAADRAIIGTLFYMAIYAAALSDAEVGQNVSLLGSDDDGPT